MHLARFVSFVRAAAFLFAVSAAAHAQQSWIAATSPTTQDLWGITYSQTFVAVGTGGAILTSSDAVRWTPQVSGTTAWLLAVVQGTVAIPGGTQARFVAVGDQGIILSGSLDASVWTLVGQGGTRLNGVAFGNGFFLAVGENGATARSTDGINWTFGNAGVTGWLRGIAFGNGRFVASGQGGTLLSTTDGVTFTALASQTASDIEAVRYNGASGSVAGTFLVAGDNGYLADSPDGTTWSVRASPSNAHYRGLAAFGYQAAAAGTGGAIAGTYLGQISWQAAATKGITADLYAAAGTPSPTVTFGASPWLAVAVGQGGAIAVFNYASDLPQSSNITGPQNPYLGQTVLLSAAPTGAAPLTYQWAFNGQPIAGATTPSLVIPNFQWAQNGSYVLTVTNLFGTLTLGDVLTAAYDPIIPNLTDESFTPDPAAQTASTKLVRPNGKIVQQSSPPVQLNADGSLDSSFRAASLAGITSFSNSPFFAQADGKLIISWRTEPTIGIGVTTPHYSSERLNPDGSIDPSYTPNLVQLAAQSTATTQNLIPQIQLADGRYMAVYIAVGPGGLQRLTPEGAIDPSYAPALSSLGSSTTVGFTLDSSNRVLFGAQTGNPDTQSSFPGVQFTIYRLNPDGTADSSFTPYSGPGSLLRLHPQANGKIVFEVQNPSSGVSYEIARLNTDGSLDGSYPGLTLSNASPTVVDWLVGPGVAQSDGSVLVAISPNSGSTASLPLVNGSYRNGLIRIDPNGNFDPAFSLNFEAAPMLDGMALQSDGKILAWGNFTYFNGEPKTDFVRFDPAAGKNFASLANISARGMAGGANGPLTVGFVISSATPKAMLLRGDGPALGAFGVRGTLPDPELTLYTSQGIPLQSDNDWQTGPSDSGTLAAAATRLGAFPLAPGSPDAALLASLSAGAYTFSVTGTGAASGIALAEAYDADLSLPGYGGSRIVNFSSKSLTSPGAAALTVGFVVGGANSKRVLIRAIGPSLTGFGVPNALPDPVLTLYSGNAIIAGGSVGDSTVIATTTQSVGAFPVGTGIRYVPMVITLSPGAYTATLTSASNATGVALLEVYEVQ